MATFRVIERLGMLLMGSLDFQKKAAGASHRGAIQGHLFFCNQEDVDEFVGKSSNKKSLPKVGTEAMTL